MDVDFHFHELALSLMPIDSQLPRKCVLVNMWLFVFHGMGQFGCYRLIYTAHGQYLNYSNITIQNHEYFTFCLPVDDTLCFRQ